MKEVNLLKITKTPVILLALVLAVTIPALALAENASGSTAPKTNYTAEEMLALAIEDEYLAQAQYKAVMDAFALDRPLCSLLRAESMHIAALSALMQAHDIPVPEDAAAGQVKVPATLTEAISAGVEAETKNIAMYESFLAQDNLPEDLRTVFTSLKNASENHLNAFLRTEQRTGTGRNTMMNRQMPGRGRQGRMQRNGGACDGNCLGLPND